MYSRYIRNDSGGYERRIVPEQEAGNREQAAGSRQQAAGEEGRGSFDSDALRAGRQNQNVSAVGPGPRPAAPRPPPPGFPGGLFGPGSSLGRLLGGLDTEDLLILAVLLLAMKQDGAGQMELLIAAVLYLWL